MDDERPKWEHSIDEETARWLSTGMITKVTHHWRMVDADNSENWIELHRKNEARMFDTDFLNANGYWEYRPNWRELVTPTSRGEQVIKDLKAIDAWEDEHRGESAGRERPRPKFQISCPANHHE